MAVPSFARQTGMACAACHLGGLGPQLTDFGTQFKIGGDTFLGGGGHRLCPNRWRRYAEPSAYRTLSNESQARLGLGRTDHPGPLHGALYARLAAKEIWGNHSLTGGAVLFDTRIQPDRGDAARLASRDVGLDVSYRWSPTPEHLVTVLANVIRESQKRDALFDAGAASNTRGRLVEHSLTAPYYWRNTYGVSLQRFALHGGNDDLLYADGFANGSPNWGATRLQVDWTPRAQPPPGEGFQPQWRLGAQYTAWDQFNGAKTNYDGNGRDASDNNTLYLFAWLAF